MTAILNHQPALDREEERNAASVTYGIVEERYSTADGTRVSYGICAYSDNDTVIDSVHDVTSDREKLQELVAKCNRIALSTAHLRDVVEDLISE